MGNVCKDVIYGTESYPTEDSKVKALSKEIRLGGNAGNIVQILPRLSDLTVDCCIKVGTCEYSACVEKEFKACGVVKVYTVVQNDASLPESLIINANNTSSRTAVNYRGSCDDLNTDEVVSVVGNLERYHWVHLEHRRNGLEFLKLARTIKSLYPGIALSIDIESIRDGFEDMLGVVDYPIVSKDVCRSLGYHNIHLALTNLSKHVRRTLIVTWAEHGAGVWLTDGTDKQTLTHPDKQHKVDNNIVICDAFHVENIIDSTGAGDSFSAGFISAAMKYGPGNIPLCLLMSCKVAASKLRHQGMVIDKECVI